MYLRYDDKACLNPKEKRTKTREGKLDQCNFRLLKVWNCIGSKSGAGEWRGRCFNSMLKGDPNFQGTLNCILQILLYHCDKQHKNINNLLFTEQNVVMSFCPSLCLLWLVLTSPFSTADVFQFLDLVLCEILNITNDHSCHCTKNRVCNNFTLRYFVSSIKGSLQKSFST